MPQCYHRSRTAQSQLFARTRPLFSLRGSPMNTSSPGSVTNWLQELKAHGDSAAQELWNRYFSQLVTLARRHLGGLARDADEEDVALSALKSVMLGVENNRFPELRDRTGLWPLL